MCDFELIFNDFYTKCIPYYAKQILYGHYTLELSDRCFWIA
jgi:hypothetical protein